MLEVEERSCWDAGSHEIDKISRGPLARSLAGDPEILHGEKVQLDVCILL